MAVNETEKRRNIARNAIIQAIALVNALNALKVLGVERSKLVLDFQTGDFSTQGLDHVDTGMMGTLFDFVVPNLSSNYDDVANGGRNTQILLQIRN